MKIMKKNFLINYICGKNNLIIVLILINLSIFSNKKLKEKRKLNQITKISIIINGTGNQSILNGKKLFDRYFNDSPSFIFINNVLQNYTDIVVYNLEDPENNITIIWDHLLTNCDTMFFGLSNITKIEFINFDTSKVTSMYGMFYNCISITFLNLKDFDTSNVQIMDAMFYYCSSLKSLDLSNFNTSSAISMNNLFEIA